MEFDIILKKYEIAADDEELQGAVVLVPEGTSLSEEALETIRHLRYYRNGREGMVLLSDRAGALAFAKGCTPEEMMEEAYHKACEVCGNMPDFDHFNMDDGCTLVSMQGSAFAFRPYPFYEGGTRDTSIVMQCVEARQELLEACDAMNVLAVVYNDADDYEEE